MAAIPRPISQVELRTTVWVLEVSLNPMKHQYWIVNVADAEEKSTLSFPPLSGVFVDIILSMRCIFYVTYSDFRFSLHSEGD